MELCVTVRRHHSFYIIVENILVMVHKGLSVLLSLVCACERVCVCVCVRVCVCVVNNEKCIILKKKFVSVPWERVNRWSHDIFFYL